MLRRNGRIRDRLDAEGMGVMRRIVSKGRFSADEDEDNRSDYNKDEDTEEEQNSEKSHRRLDTTEDARLRSRPFSAAERVDQRENRAKSRKKLKTKSHKMSKLHEDSQHMNNVTDRVNNRMSIYRKNKDEERQRKADQKARPRRRCRGKKCSDEPEKEAKSLLPQTPCLALDVVNGQNVSHPSVSICPRSTERRGQVDLSISNDDIWDSLTPFQQFLWYADEIEHRWHTLQKRFYNNYKIAPEYRRHIPGGGSKPTFIEVTWDDKEELQDGINWVRGQLGCTPAMFVTNEHPHVKHDHGALNCSQFIWEDLEYRKKMRFSSKTSNILFPSNLPQHVDSPECREDRAELEMKIREYSKFHGIPYNPGQWKLPDE